MCGINGIYAHHYAAPPPEEAELLRTREAMAARGPDGKGLWWSQDRRIGFGHRRLSIQDLSDKAAQPMISANGRFVMTYNGEIYNAPELRRELIAKGILLRTQGDTELVLELFALEGANSVKKLRGMFALAIWDTQDRVLFLARDPYGIKPLYTAQDGWTFRFASQVKALVKGGRVSTDPEAAGLVGFHLFGSIPEPFTLYRDIRALPAGHLQMIDRLGPRAPRPYTSIANELHDTSYTEGNDPRQMQDAIRQSVAAHMLSDVPVGVFLSAGIDSGALLGLMKDAGQSQTTAITLAFEEFRGTSEDEAPLAAEVAKHYGADHQIHTITRDEFEQDLPHIFDAMDQPSIDGINTWFVAKAAKAAGLKVALSGLGGDELFGGYPSFHDVPRSVSLFALASAVPGAGDLGAALLAPFARQRPKLRGTIKYGGTWAGAYLLRRGLFLPEELKTILNPDMAREGLHRLQPLMRLAQITHAAPHSNHARVTALESSWYMRNQLLRDADWAGMAHGIEIRTPLVDVNLLRAAAPFIRRGTIGDGKALLANAPSRPLPATVTERAKTGFFVPTQAWASGELTVPAATKGLVSRVWARNVMKTFCADEPAPNSQVQAA